jgi:Phage integrase, N-terminal SAM-like domain
VARKNGNGEGSRPRERADGRWEARYWKDGKRRGVYGSTHKGAADKLVEAQANKEEAPTGFEPMNITVREFFGQYDDVARGTMKRRSYETYRDIARLHLLPAFGTMKLKDFGTL